MSHPGLQKLNGALTEKTYCAGTHEIQREQANLFYRSNSSEHTARIINLANSTVDDLDALNKACQPATFGRDNLDVLDESYRKAGKIDATDFASSFVLQDTNILDIVTCEFLDAVHHPHKVLRPELYKLNVYDKGAFFKAHKDTPRAENMIASIVIVFSTPHEGGALILRHKGQEWTFDSAKAVATSPTTIGYVAFYSDVEHEVSPITSGHRVTLTYNLYLESRIPLTRVSLEGVTNPSYDLLKSAFQEVLADSSILPEGGRLGFGMSHEYPFLTDIKNEETHRNPEGRQVSRMIPYLKGIDDTLFCVCKELALKASLRVLYDLRDDGGRILLDKVVDLSDGMYEENMVVYMHKDLKGEVESTTSRFFYPQRVTLKPVQWVTDVMSVNKVEVAYTAYGNNAWSTCMYGNICLVVEVGEPGQRETL